MDERTGKTQIGIRIRDDLLDDLALLLTSPLSPYTSKDRTWLIEHAVEVMYRGTAKSLRAAAGAARVTSAPENT